MKILTQLLYGRIKMSESKIDDTYFIEQGDNNMFYIVSENGYWGYDGEGYANLEAAIKHVKHMIKNYFYDRCEPNPKGWPKNAYNK